MSLSSSYGVTSPRFHVLSADLSTVLYTYYLPIPTREGISLTWEEKGTSVVELLNGARRKKIKGYGLKCNLKYSIYNDLPSENSRTIGTADGQLPTGEDLLNILSQYGQSRLEFSPSSADPFFKCLITKLPTLTPISNIAFKSYEIEIVSRDIFASADLSASIIP